MSLPCCGLRSRLPSKKEPRLTHLALPQHNFHELFDNCPNDHNDDASSHLNLDNRDYHDPGPCSAHHGGFGYHKYRAV